MPARLRKVLIALAQLFVEYYMHEEKCSSLLIAWHFSTIFTLHLLKTYS